MLLRDKERYAAAALIVMSSLLSRLRAFLRAYAGGVGHGVENFISDTSKAYFSIQYVVLLP